MDWKRKQTLQALFISTTFDEKSDNNLNNLVYLAGPENKVILNLYVSNYNAIIQKRLQSQDIALPKQRIMLWIQKTAKKIKKNNINIKQHRIKK